MNNMQSTALLQDRFNIINTISKNSNNITIDNNNITIDNTTIDNTTIDNTTIDNNNINYNSIIKNYLENYFELSTNMYHVSYLQQIIWYKLVDAEEIKYIYNDIIDKHIIQTKQHIKKSIKNDNFSLLILKQIFMKFNCKISKIVFLLKLNINNSSMFIMKILNEPILFNYLEQELCNLDSETVNSVKFIITIIKPKQNEWFIKSNDLIWFLKLIGNSLKNNAIKLFNIDINIPEKYKLFYKLNNLIDYRLKIINIYEHIIMSVAIINLFEPINELLYDAFNDVIPLCNITELINLINNNYKFITNNSNKFEQSIFIYLQKTIKTYINDFTSQDILNFLNLISICSNLKLNLVNDIFLSIIFSNDKLINMILDVIHNYINTDFKFIKDIVSFIKSIPNKDVFISNCHRLLIQRILSNQTNIDNESSLIRLFLDNGIGLLNIYKLHTVIIDKRESDSTLINYHNITGKYNFDNIVTSYANWDINYNQGYITFNNIITNNTVTNTITTYILDYQEYYEKIHINKRKLIWLLQYGEVNITYNNIEIILLPIQLLVLELFNDNKRISLNNIKSQDFFNNYSTKFKDDIINSLINGKILFFSDIDILELSNSNNISNNLIDIYLHNNICKTIFINPDIELAHNREDIIRCLINHHIKIEPKNKNDLYKLIEQKITLFKLTDELFNKALDMLLKLDYIIIEDNKYIKCIY